MSHFVFAKWQLVQQQLDHPLAVHLLQWDLQRLQKMEWIKNNYYADRARKE
jgi:hypothetical protein